jgi:hypothetical protein
MNSIATHQSPAWLQKSNFILRADLSNHGMPGRLEQLWARKIDPSTFEICCIPFYTYGIALGDKVRLDASGTIQEVKEKAGHKNLRVAIALITNRNDIHEVLHEWVNSTGLLHEWCTPYYLAVDLPPSQNNQNSFTMLEDLYEEGAVFFEVDG